MANLFNTHTHTPHQRNVLLRTYRPHLLTRHVHVCKCHQSLARTRQFSQRLLVLSTGAREVLACFRPRGDIPERSGLASSHGDHVDRCHDSRSTAGSATRKSRTNQCVRSTANVQRCLCTPACFGTRLPLDSPNHFATTFGLNFAPGASLHFPGDVGRRTRRCVPTDG